MEFFIGRYNVISVISFNQFYSQNFNPVIKTLDYNSSDNKTLNISKDVFINQKH